MHANKVVRHLVAVLGLMLSALTIAGGQSAFGASPPGEGTTGTWQQAIAQSPTGSLTRGCYQTSYPSLQWHDNTCKVAPEVPFAPASLAAPANATVGNATDYSAKVTGTISSATGSFADVSPTITETGQYGGQGAQIANTFSLQLNTEFFLNSPACSGSAVPSNCLAWQQFIYANDSNGNVVFMQYWLINYNATCPSGWYSYSSDCYTNSQASLFPGGILTAADLATAQLTGSALPGGNDEVTLTFGGNGSSVISSDSILGLAPHWNIAEFNVFGDGGSGQANFGANTTLQAQTTLADSSLSAPTCVEEGFTGETNNLSLSNTPTIGTHGLPTIVSEQTNTSPTTPSCASGPGSKTATTVSGALHSASGPSGPTISVPPGTAVSDLVGVFGTNSSVATGTVTYNVYSDSNCSDLASAGTAEPITTSGSEDASAPVTLHSAGTYYWQATYSGDTYNNSSTSSCGSEIETVGAPPTTSVLFPSSGATLSGSTLLDASASNATSVEFRLFGGSYGLNAPVLCTATPTYYGWLCNWNTTTVPGGTYFLASEAFGAGGSTFSPGVGVTVSNPPTTSVLFPSSGATLSGSTLLDASASNATSVEFRLFGGSYGLNAPVLCTATPTYYGWLCNWNTTTVPSGTYFLASEAFGSGGNTFSPGVSVTVHN